MTVALLTPQSLVAESTQTARRPCWATKCASASRVFRWVSSDVLRTAGTILPLHALDVHSLMLDEWNVPSQQWCRWWVTSARNI